MDALIICAADTESSTARSWVTDTNDLGIPLVCYDRLISNVAGIEWYLSWDNNQVGVEQGQYILNNTSAGDTILFFTGPGHRFQRCSI